MSSSSSVTVLLSIITQKMTISLGFIILIGGIIGGILNLFIFLSLRTFRQSSCAYYLTIMSFANIMHLTFSFIPHIVINGFGIDWAANSLIYCKVRVYIVQFWLLTSFTCMCLSTIDQYLSTCFNPRWHKFSNIKIARSILIGILVFVSLHGIPFAIFYNLIPSPTNPNQTICTISNFIYQRYNTFGYVFLMMGVLPLTTMTFFGSLAYYNVRNLSYRTIPLVQRATDKQITQMVLSQVIYNFFIISPYVITSLAAFIDPTNTQIPYIRTMSVTIHNLYFAGSFYIYFSTSKRFRQQFNHVFCKIHFNRFKQGNQIAPHQPPTSTHSF